MEAKNDFLLEKKGEIVRDKVAEVTKRVSKIKSNAKSKKTAKKARVHVLNE